jgi:hypothetical protein
MPCRGLLQLVVKHPYDDTFENQNEEQFIPKSFSLKRKMIAGIRARAAYLGLSLSAYVAALVHNDLVRGIHAPLSIVPAQAPSKVGQSSPHGVVVPEFDLDD